MPEYLNAMTGRFKNVNASGGVTTVTPPAPFDASTMIYETMQQTQQYQPQYPQLELQPQNLGNVMPNVNTFDYMGYAPVSAPVPPPPAVNEHEIEFLNCRPRRYKRTKRTYTKRKNKTTTKQQNNEKTTATTGAAATTNTKAMQMPSMANSPNVQMSFKMMTMDITKTEPNMGPNNPQSAQNPNNGNGNPNIGNPNGNNNGLTTVSAVGNANSNANNNNNGNGSQLCAGCGKHIQDRYLLRALDMLWHEDCLKCGCCDCRLGEVGSTLYTKGNLMLCKRDYLRLFGNTGYCAACSKVIPAFEMVMRARTNVYHLECFACQQCNHRFCVGDRFYLCENKILCEYDYEERLVFASMANHPMLKRHASAIGQGSPTGAGGLMGGGSPGGPGSVVQNGPRTPGDHNNNNGPQTGPGGSPFGVQAAAAAHMKNSLGASS
ncbi:zyxin [Bactrocera dorsalis]|uniref:Zyxin n=1 Tax=Bactrocera dorsalis TaxID=27457 RepID=A0A6I9V007_BACDO|nr:zyxin [Bactrocera dorsalis]